MGDVQSFISPESLMKKVRLTAGVHIIDVRKEPALRDSGRIVNGALWRDHEGVTSWACAYSTGDTLIIYCVHGHEVSQNAAKELRNLGFNTFYVTGGFEAYVDAGGETILYDAAGRSGESRE